VPSCENRQRVSPRRAYQIACCVVGFSLDFIHTLLSLERHYSKISISLASSKQALALAIRQEDGRGK